MNAERTSVGALVLAACLCACDLPADPLGPGEGSDSATGLIAKSALLPAVQRAALDDLLTRVLPGLGESAAPLHQALRNLASAQENDQPEAAASAQAALATYTALNHGQNAAELDVIRLTIAAAQANR